MGVVYRLNGATNDINIKFYLNLYANEKNTAFMLMLLSLLAYLYCHITRNIGCALNKLLRIYHLKTNM